MQIVADANPLISILIKPGKPIELLFLESLELVAPSLLFEEIEQNKEIIIKKSQLNQEELEEFILILKEQIKIILEQEFIAFREQAIEICPDKKDIVYFALALYLQCPIWSNEKQLRNQKSVKVYATHELIELFHLKEKSI